MLIIFCFVFVLCRETPSRRTSTTSSPSSPWTCTSSLRELPTSISWLCSFYRYISKIIPSDLRCQQKTRTIQSHQMFVSLLDYSRHFHSALVHHTDSSGRGAGSHRHQRPGGWSGKTSHTHARFFVKLPQAQTTRSVRFPAIIHS